MASEVLPSWKILLIDDDEDEFVLARNFLSNHGNRYDLIWVHDADSGMRELLSGSYDAALVDYWLGSENGVNVIHQARAQGVTIPLIMITGSAEPQVDNQAMQAGATDFLNRDELTPALLERVLRYSIRNSVAAREAQAQLEAERNRLRSVIDSAPAGILLTDAAGQFMLLNPAVQRFFPSTGISGDADSPAGGYTIHDLDGNLLTGDQLPLPRSLRGERLSEETVVFRHADGREIITQVNSTPIRSDAGQLIGAVAVMMDVTEQLKMAADLRSSEERFRLASQSTRGFVWDYDVLTDRVYRSNGVEDLTGYTWEEIPQNRTGWLNLIHPDDRPTGDASEAPEPLKDHTYSLEYRIVQKNGQVRWVMEQGNIQLGENGEPVRVVGSTIDIDARKQAELSLQASEERFQRVLSNTPTVVFTMDRDLRYTWIHNPRHGLTVEDVLGKTDCELLPPDAAEIITRPKLEVLRSGKPIRCELTYSIRGDLVAYFAAYEPIFSKDGQVVGLSGVTMDITDRIQLQRQQQQDQAKIEIQHSIIGQREQERLQIARDLHDGPLQNLSALAFQLNTLLVRLNGEEERAILGEVKAVLNETVNELRSYATELRPPLLASFGLERAIRQHLDDFRRRHPHIHVEFTAHHSTDLLLETPRIAMYRIYQEAMNNIVKHSHAGRVEIMLESDDSMARLEIRDDGNGFELPAHWLELARQKHLGVVGMIERAEAVGGRADVQSTPGAGTCVRVWLPVHIPVHPV